jgi:hypothetical protein
MKAIFFCLFISSDVNGLLFVGYKDFEHAQTLWKASKSKQGKHFSSPSLPPSVLFCLVFLLQHIIQLLKGHSDPLNLYFTIVGIVFLDA